MGIRTKSEKRLDRLTPRERQVIMLLAGGLKAPAVAAELRVTRNTARVHVQNILRKLGLHSQLEAVVWVLRQGAPAAKPRASRARAV